MSKFINILSPAALASAAAATLAALFLAGCSKEAFTDTPADITMRFEIPTIETKSYLTDDYHICWEAGKDEVSLFSKTNNYRFTVKDDGTDTWLEGKIAEATSRYYAIYPYDPDATNSTGFVTTTLPAQQKAVRNQFSNIVAVASTNTNELHFQNCVTLVEVELESDNVKAISFRGNNGELVAGTFRISIPSSDTTAPSGTIISGSKEVSISDGGKVLAPGKYYLAIAPQTFTRGITITQSGDYGSVEKVTTNKVTATRSKRLRSGLLDFRLTSPDTSFRMVYDDGEQSGTIYGGQKKSFVYSYSGNNSFRYSFYGSGSVKVSYYLGDSTTPGNYAGILEKGLSSSSGILNILPCQGEGGLNDNVQRLRSASWKGSESSPADLSAASSALPGTGLKGINTANCYVVRAPGWYSFPLVYGNAIKNGIANTAAYAPAGSGSSVLTPFRAASGAITDPYINGSGKKAVSARIEWQDAIGLIDDAPVIIGSGNSSDKVVFHVPAETIREGNAVISVLDEGGTVLWSWHIWVTGASDSELQSISVTNKNSASYNFLKMHVGWVAPYSDPITYPSRKLRVVLTINDINPIELEFIQVGAILPANILGNCPFYQWGRKDPFVAGNGTSETDADGNGIKKTWYNGARRDTVGTRAALLGNDVANFVRHPSVYNITSNGDNKYSNLWNATQEKTGSTATVVKTVYDPSPAGYCLPPIAAWSAFTSDNVSGGFDYGFNFYSKPSKAGDTTFYPALGSMSTSNNTSTRTFGALRNVGTSVSVWSANPNQASSAYYLSASYNFTSGAISVNTNYGANRQYVYPIRPIEEQ